MSFSPWRLSPLYLTDRRGNGIQIESNETTQQHRFICPARHSNGVNYVSFEQASLTVDSLRAVSLSSEPVCPQNHKWVVQSGMCLYAGLSGVVVTPPPPTIAVTLPVSTLLVGLTAQATAIVYDQFGAVIPAAVVSWESSNPTLATVDSFGLITAVASGSVTITATYQLISGFVSLAVIVISPVPVATTVVVSIPVTSIEVGPTTTATAVIRDQFGAIMLGLIVVWSSSDPSIATVNASSGVVTGVSVGSVSITATYGLISGSAPLNITQASSVATSITVSIPVGTLATGSTTTASAIVRDQFNAIMPVVVVWSSSNVAVATVNSFSGVVTGVTVGTINITATYLSVSGFTSLSIVVPSNVPQFAPNKYTLASGVTFDVVTGLYSKPLRYFGALPLRRFDVINTGANDFAPINASQLTTALASLTGKTDPIIQLTAGNLYAGSFNTPPSGTYSGHLVIRTGTLAAFPVDFDGNISTRVSPADFPNMATIKTTSAAGPIRIGANCQKIWIEGVDIMTAHTTSAVIIGGSLFSITASAAVPNTIGVVHCYIHQDPTAAVPTLNVRGIAAEGDNLLLAGNYVSRWVSTGADPGAYGCVGTCFGRQDIVNNYLEGTGENVAFGGGDTFLDGVESWPHDIWFYHNFSFKNPAWLNNGWPVKNQFEFKKIERITIVGNIFDGSWTHGQTGECFALKSTNQGGTAPDAPSVDITIRFNIIRNCGCFAQIVTAGDQVPSPHPVNNPLSRLEIRDNLAYDLYDIGPPGGTPGNNDVGFLKMAGVAVNLATDWSYEHNTLSFTAKAGPEQIFTGSTISRVPTIDRITVRDNICAYGTYGWLGQGKAEGTASLTTWWTNYLATHNLMHSIGGGRPAPSMTNYPSGNFYEASETAVGYVNIDGKNFAIPDGTLYGKNGTRAASDNALFPGGKAMGADVAMVLSTCAGVE